MSLEARQTQRLFDDHAHGGGIVDNQDLHPKDSYCTP
jgi:hypothetical protein